MDLSTTEFRFSLFNFETKELVKTFSTATAICISSYEGLSI